MSSGAARRSPTADELVALRRAIEDVAAHQADTDRAVRGLAARLARLSAQRPDEERALALLATIARNAAHTVFSSRELIAHAEVVSGELGTALDAAGLRTARRLGKFLRRHAGARVGAVQLQRLGDDRDGAIWGFVACGSAGPTLAERLAPPAARRLP
jgi:hypothetical protein